MPRPGFEPGLARERVYNQNNDTALTTRPLLSRLIVALQLYTIINLADSCTIQHRGHPFKIHPPRTGSITRRKFFDVRVIEKWNSLPEDVVCSDNVNIFKNRLDAYTERRGTFYEL